MEDFARVLATHGIGLVFVAVLAARIGAPVPAAPLLVVAGALAAAGRIGLPALVLASLAANLAGDAVWFAAGRWYGRRVMRVLCKVSMSPDSCVRQSESLIERWGGSSLTAAKFVPGVSVVAAPMAGALGMPWPRFVAYDSFAAIAWTAVYVALGWVLSDQVEVALALLAQAGGAAALLLALAVVAWLGWRWWRRRRVMQHTTVPRIGIDDLHARLAGPQPPVVIDVRADIASTLDSRRIPGALPITLAALDASRLPRERLVVLYCDCPNEVSAALGALALMRAGIADARALEGGLQGWIDAGRPVEAVVPAAQAATSAA